MLVFLVGFDQFKNCVKILMNMYITEYFISINISVNIYLIHWEQYFELNCICMLIEVHIVIKQKQKNYVFCI